MRFFSLRCRCRGCEGRRWTDAGLVFPLRSYLIAAVLNLTEVAKHDDWRVRTSPCHRCRCGSDLPNPVSSQILFYFAAAVSAAAALFRLVLPESAYFVERREAEKASGATVSSGQKSKIFLREAGRALRLHWVRCIFAVVLMTCFNFFS